MFVRAEKLGMTVEELGARMSHAEFIEWQALDHLRAEERERAERMAGKGMRPR